MRRSKLQYCPLQPEQAAQMLPRLRMDSQIRIIYQREGKLLMAYNTRVGRVLMNARVELDDWFGSLELALWEATEKLGKLREAQCYTKRV